MRSNDDAITQAERRFQVRLPEDYRHFPVTDGTMARFVPPAGDFLMLHAAEELIEINEAGEFQDRFPCSVQLGGRLVLASIARSGLRWSGMVSRLSRKPRSVAG
ncbi:hypothetical protein [Streptomyces sp. LN704]|uniref:hypothetical protein n=1 Tax=Streptomyces sp. LN704 TaxID=3112982 RepID=UPI003718D9B7